MSDKKKIAICSCGAPLIYTFMFSGAEYFCIECGSKYGMFDTESTEVTPALKKRSTANKAKWSAISADLLTGGVMFRSCTKCDKGDSHLSHATPEEVKKHEKALKKLREITS